MFLGIHIQSEIVFETNDSNLNLDSVKYDVYKKGQVPVIGESSDKKSDLSLEELFQKVAHFNIKNSKTPKSVKLVFKSTETLTESVWIIQLYKVSIN